MGKYTSETDVEAFTQMDIKDDTNPNSTEVGNWIDEVEAMIDAQLLGTYTATDVKIDVEPTFAYAKNTIKWLEEVSTYGYSEPRARIVIPPYLPIISVTKLYRNTASLSQAENWEELVEGPGANTHFIVLKRRTKTGALLGFAFYIYDNIPTAGRERLKATYTYGWNLSTNILREYATLKVAEKVLTARVLSGEPVGIASYTGPDLQSFVNTQYQAMLDYIERRTKEIEERYFPNNIAIATLRA